MTEISEKEIEAAIKAIEAVPIMGDTYSLSGEDAKAAARAALSAAARVREEDNGEGGAGPDFSLQWQSKEAERRALYPHHAPQPSGKIEEAAQIIQAFIDQEVDYMMRNNLGNPEKQHNVKWGRKWL